MGTQHTTHQGYFRNLKWDILCKVLGMVLTHNKNLLNFSHITTNKSKFLILDHLLSIGIQNPFIQKSYSRALKYLSDFLENRNYLEWKVERGRKHLLPPSGSYTLFGSRILPSKICSAYSQHPTACSVMPKRWMIAQAPDIPLTSCPFLHQNLIGTAAGGMGACLGLGGGWDGNRWWFGRVIKTLDICFNELATQQIKYCNSESQSSQTVITDLFTECLLLVKPCIFYCPLECNRV